MTSYFAINASRTWIASGSYGECLALSLQHCQENVDEEAYLVRCRAGESKGLIAFVINAEGYRQSYPPQTIPIKELKRLHRSLGL